MPGEEAAALFDRHRNDTRPRRHDLAGEKTDALRTEFIGDPSHRESRITENVGTDPFTSDGSVQLQADNVFAEVDRAPVGGGRFTQDEMMSTRIVGDELRRTDDAEVVVA